MTPRTTPAQGLKAALRGGDATREAVRPPMEVRVNFEEAISAHQKWKSRLRLQIDGSSTEMLDPAIVCQDTQCDLGKWIHGEGGRHMGGKSEFLDVKRTHAHFHVVAAEVLKKAKSGDRHGASLDLDGPFFQASTQVVQALMKCRQACG